MQKERKMFEKCLPIFGISPFTFQNYQIEDTTIMHDYMQFKWLSCNIMAIISTREIGISRGISGFTILLIRIQLNNK